jgi:hypothetical protein
MDALLCVCVCVWFRITLCVSGGEMERKSILATPIVVDKFFVCDFFSLLILSPSLSRKESVTRRKSFFFFSFFPGAPIEFHFFFLSFLFIFILTFFFHWRLPFSFTR